MHHPLEIKIARLRGRQRALAMAHGVSCLVIAAVAGVAVLGTIDYWIRFQDPGMRVICALALLGLLGWSAYRFLYLQFSSAKWHRCLAPVRLAQRVEETFPQLGDSLASSVEFLDQAEDDPLAGSAALRRAVIAATTAKTQDLNFTDSLDHRPAVRATTTAVAMCLLAGTFALLDPLWVQVAVARLAYPFGEVSWPQKTHLELVHRVERVAAGGIFEVEAVDAAGAKLPTDAKIFYRLAKPDGAVEEQTEPMRHLGQTLLARRENVTREFSYRIEGGDDRSMQWIDVEVVEPPSVRSLSVRLVPPSYTAWPTVTLDENRAAGFRALVGSTVHIKATANKRLRSVTMHLGREKTIPAQLSRDGLSFVVAADRGFVVEDSTDFWFEMVDRQGLQGGADMRWDIRAVEDRPPSISIERPTSTVYATPQATVPLRVLVKDDLAVQNVTLLARLENAKPPNVERPPNELKIVLFEGPKTAPQSDKPGGVGQRPTDGFPTIGAAGQSLPIDYRWKLDGLKLGGAWLQPGSQAVFYVTADDYRPQQGRSDTRRLIVITPQQMADRIAARQEFILAELARVLKMQRQTRAQVAALIIRLEETGRLGPVGLDQLRRAERGQRQATVALSGGEDGVPARILSLLQNLQNNRLDSPQVQRRMGGLLGEIDRLAKENLTIITTEMTASVKSAQVHRRQQTTDENKNTKNTDRATLAALGIVDQNQVVVIEALQNMLGRLSQWDNYRRFHREVGRLIREQEDLRTRTLGLGRKTLTKDLGDLRPQEAAELRIAARDQAELARWLDRITQSMAQTLAKLDVSDPLAAETLGDALHSIAQRRIAAVMRGTDDNLRRNRMGQASGDQRRVIDDLQEVLNILANRREHELTRLVKRLRQAESQLAELIRRQQQLLDKLQKPEERQLPRLADEQKAITEEAQRIARRLQRLLAQGAAEQTAAAAEAMSKAAQNVQKGDVESAKKEAHRARQALERAAAELAQRRRRAEAELATEKMAGLLDALKALVRREDKAIEETRRLDAMQKSAPPLTPGQLASLHNLAREQAVLAQDTRVLADKTGQAGVFKLALSTAAAKMEGAADRLRQRQTGGQTLALQHDAQRRLGQLLDALKSAKKEQKDSGGGGGKGGGSSGQGIKLLARLKLFKMLQEEINKRTGELEKEHGGQKRPPENIRREYQELAEEQRRLADLMLQLLPAAD